MSDFRKFKDNLMEYAFRKGRLANLSFDELKEINDILNEKKAEAFVYEINHELKLYA